MVFQLINENVSCVLNSGQWSYSFKNKFSNTTDISTFQYSNGSSIIIDGDVDQAANSTIQIILSSQNQGGALTVTGMCDIEGKYHVSFGKKAFRWIDNCYFGDIKLFYQ